MLLKNEKVGEKPMLPLPKKAAKILVAGSHADNLGYQCGGWTIQWQGLDGNNLTQGITISQQHSTLNSQIHVYILIFALIFLLIYMWMH